ncbi:MAG: hypothetical protein GY797_38960 [Deltaproteobacteria bacterium]|nr:hypothetical protein [Deltaproteobacteria bacterium]
MAKVESIGHLKDDALLVTPEQCIKSVLEDDLGKRGAFKNGKKVIVIALDDTDGDYNISFSQGGFRMSELLSLMDVFKKHVLGIMGY